MKRKKKNKGILWQIVSEGRPIASPSMTLKDLEDLILQVSATRIETSPILMIAGIGGKDNYVKAMKEKGMPEFMILQSITDNGDGTFTIKV